MPTQNVTIPDTMLDDIYSLDSELKKLRIIQNRFLVKKIIETNFQNFKLKKI